MSTPAFSRAWFAAGEPPGIDFGNALLANAQGVYNAQEYIGGPPDGSTDNTTALDNMFTDYKAKGYRGVLYFPPAAHSYMYSGSGWNGVAYNVVGGGWNESVIQLGTGVYLLKPSGAISIGNMRDIQIKNGAGCYKQTTTGASSNHGFTFDHVWFTGYTTCAVGSLASDDPYMRFDNCVFQGTIGQSIGIALNGDISGGHIRGCHFSADRYHVKLGEGGLDFRIYDCDFLRNAAYVSTPRVDIWIVPNTSATNAGNGCTIFGNKFGNENINGADFKILYASQDTTVTDFTDTPHSTSTNTGVIRGHVIGSNRSSGSTGASPSFIYSYVDDVDGLVVHPNVYDGTAPSYALEFANSAAKTTTKTYYGPQVHASSGLLTFSNRSITSL